MNKYPKGILKTAEKVLSKSSPKEEVPYKSGAAMLKSLRKRIGNPAEKEKIAPAQTA